MTRLHGLVLASTILSIAVACGDDDGATDGGGDAGGTDSAMPPDSGETDGARPDGGDPDAARPDAGEGMIPVFVAQGHVGRTTVSCDGGRSWVADRSMDDAAVCWPETGEYDCDHHPGAGKGITYGNGYWYATWGWGPPGGIDRSTDGVTWERVVEETTYGGIAFGDGVVLAASRNARRSTSLGTSWEDTGDTMLGVWNVRRAGFAEGRFVMVGSDGDDRDVVVSSDLGATWQVPTIPTECGSGVQTNGGIVGGNGTILILGSDGNACTSTDGGTTFQANSVGGEVRSQVVWNGSAFMAWNRGTMYSSPDGVTWSSAPTTPGDLSIGPVAYHSDEGVYVAVRGGWQVWYDRQVFYRSTDGVSWEEADTYTGRHPIRFIEAGYLGACPE